MCKLSTRKPLVTEIAELSDMFDNYSPLFAKLFSGVGRGSREIAGHLVIISSDK